MEYAFLRALELGVKRADQIHGLLNEATPGLVDAVTVASHTNPNVVFVRCSREPTAAEQDAMQKLISTVP